MRREHDLINDPDIPANVIYGVHTLRALEIFAITGTSISIYPNLVVALACVKQAAMLANNELGLLDDRQHRQSCALARKSGWENCWSSSWWMSFRVGP